MSTEIVREQCIASNKEKVAEAISAAKHCTEQKEMFLDKYPYMDVASLESNEYGVAVEFEEDVDDDTGVVIVRKYLQQTEDSDTTWDSFEFPILLQRVEITPIDCSLVEAELDYKPPVVKMERPKYELPERTLEDAIQECHELSETEASEISEKIISDELDKGETQYLYGEYEYTNSRESARNGKPFTRWTSDMDDGNLVTTMVIDVDDTYDGSWGKIQFPLDVAKYTITKMDCDAIEDPDYEYESPKFIKEDLLPPDPNDVEEEPDEDELLNEQIQSCVASNKMRLKELADDEFRYSNSIEKLLGKYQYNDADIESTDVGVFARWVEEDKGNVIVLKKYLMKGTNYDGSWGAFEFPILLQETTITAMDCESMKYGDEYEDPKVVRQYPPIEDPNKEIEIPEEEEPKDPVIPEEEEPVGPVIPELPGIDDENDGEIDTSKTPYRCDVNTSYNAPHPSASTDKLIEYYAKSTICRSKRYPVVMPKVKVNKE